MSERKFAVELQRLADMCTALIVFTNGHETVCTTDPECEVEWILAKREFMLLRSLLTSPNGHQVEIAVPTPHDRRDRISRHCESQLTFSSLPVEFIEAKDDAQNAVRLR